MRAAGIDHNLCLYTFADKAVKEQSHGIDRTGFGRQHPRRGAFGDLRQLAGGAKPGAAFGPDAGRVRPGDWGLPGLLPAQRAEGQ